jgi:hypothetical protein
MSIYGTFVDLFLILVFCSKCAKASSIFVILTLFKASKEQKSPMGIQKDLDSRHGALVSSLYLHSENEIFSAWNPCCGSRIFVLDPNFSIPDPGSKRYRIRIRIKELLIFLTFKTVSKLSEK